MRLQLKCTQLVNDLQRRLADAIQSQTEAAVTAVVRCLQSRMRSALRTQYGPLPHPLMSSSQIRQRDSEAAKSGSKRGSISDTLHSARSTTAVAEMREQVKTLTSEVQELRGTLRRKQEELDELKTRVRKCDIQRCFPGQSRDCLLACLLARALVIVITHGDGG
jgi:hypothetical protein